MPNMPGVMLRASVLAVVTFFLFYIIPKGFIPNDDTSQIVGYTEAAQGISFEVETPTRFHVVGIDKGLVGETAARVRKIRPPEPYLGKGIRYADERIRRKAGKAGKVGAKK